MRRSWPQAAYYRLVRGVCRLALLPLARPRCHGQSLMPANGPALICANHQSFLDPVLVGTALRRPLNYLARETLFRFPLGPLIRGLNAIPLDRDGGGMSGLREALRRLHEGEAVVVFPEGTRTADGELQPLQPGVAVLARRSKAPLVPIGIDGAFDVFPRGALLPRPGVVDLVVGPPIPAERAASLRGAELVAELERSIRGCFEEARRRRRSRLGLTIDESIEEPDAQVAPAAIEHSPPAAPASPLPATRTSQDAPS